jgi:hypothetical protein
MQFVGLHLAWSLAAIIEHAWGNRRGSWLHNMIDRPF